MLTVALRDQRRERATTEAMPGSDSRSAVEQAAHRHMWGRLLTTCACSYEISFWQHCTFRTSNIKLGLLFLATHTCGIVGLANSEKQLLSKASIEED